MSSKFYPKPALFEQKSQAIPNAFIFDRSLSSNSVRLLLVLNAMTTSGFSWTPRQSDIQNRLGWGREKFDNARKECCENGYMRVRQTRNDDKKTWSHNEFEFCLDGSFKEKSIEQSQEKPAHNESEPLTGFPTSANPPLLNKDKYKQQQQKKASPSSKPSASVVVVSSKSKKSKQDSLEEAKAPDKPPKEPVVSQEVEDAIEKYNTLFQGNAHHLGKSIKLPRGRLISLINRFGCDEVNRAVCYLYSQQLRAQKLKKQGLPSKEVDNPIKYLELIVKNGWSSEE